MKTYRINKYAERLAQGTGFAPELIYNISLVRFQGRNGRCIAAWTPGMKRPRYVYKAHTPEEYDKAMSVFGRRPSASAAMTRRRKRLLQLSANRSVSATSSTRRGAGSRPISTSIRSWRSAAVR